MKLFHGEIINNTVTINDEEQTHIAKVLRMRNGEEIFVTDGKGNLAKGYLISCCQIPDIRFQQLSFICLTEIYKIQQK